MSKPEVFYVEVIVPPVAGRRAVVRLQDGHHTLSKEALDAYDGIVTTSTIIEVNGTDFETQNTLYKFSAPVVE